MEPFNLEAAKRGDPIVYGTESKPAEFLYHDEKTNTCLMRIPYSEKPVVYYDYCTHFFMAPKKRTPVDNLRLSVFTVLEGWTLPHDVRKILEAAYYYEDTPTLSNAGSETNIPAVGIAPKGNSLVSLHNKEWVGLTNKERNEMIGRISHDCFTTQRDLIETTQTITEMYLKERNA